MNTVLNTGRALVATISVTVALSLAGCASDDRPSAADSPAPEPTWIAPAPATGSTPPISRSGGGCRGVVKSYNSTKGFGYITETATGQVFFVHVSGLMEDIQAGHEVRFEVVNGAKGPTAISVRLC